MLDKLHEVEARYDRLSGELADPNLTRDPSRFQQVARAHAELSEVVAKYRELLDVERQVAETKGMVDETDGELRDLAEVELRELTERRSGLERELVLMLLPKDPNDEKDTIIE